MTPRFLQVHPLTSYTATLLNRDDSGLAKRLPYGGVLRTRISSQCLKRHWRMANDPHALGEIEGTTKGSRQTLLFGQPEVDWLAKEAKRLATEAGSSAEQAVSAAKAWRDKFRANIKAMRDGATLQRVSRPPCSVEWSRRTRKRISPPPCMSPTRSLCRISMATPSWSGASCTISRI